MPAKRKTHEKDLIKELLLFAEQTIDQKVTEAEILEHLKKNGFKKITDEGLLKEKFLYFRQQIWPSQSKSGDLQFDINFYPFILEINKLEEIKKITEGVKKYAFRAAELLALIIAVLIIYLMFVPFTAELVPRQETILRDIDTRIETVSKDVQEVGKQVGVVKKQVEVVEKKVKKSWLLR